MHPNPSFRANDPEWQDAMIRQLGFATLFSITPSGPRVAHTPMILRAGRVLHFHLARSNVLSRHLDGALAVAVFNGPDAYISARWYEDPDQVPTWNYIALECEGTVRRLPDAVLHGFLADLIDQHEQRQAHGVPWTMDKMDDAKLQPMLRAIVAFELPIRAVHETVKLSQNKPPAERARLIAGLDAEGRAEMAQTMRGWTA
jgi:transcriptional regulator